MPVLLALPVLRQDTGGETVKRNLITPMIVRRKRRNKKRRQDERKQGSKRALA